MADPPTRPALRERYDRKQAEVVDVAARLFAERGYAATSIADLVEATGLTAGGLYHYIGSKEALLVRICDVLLEPLLAEAEALVAREDLAPDARLRELVRLWLGHVEAHQPHMRVFEQERRVLEREPQWRRVRDARKRFERLLDGVLAECRAAGALAHPDPDLAKRALLGMVNHTAHWFRGRGRLSAAELADGYADLVLAPR